MRVGHWLNDKDGAKPKFNAFHSLPYMIFQRIYLLRVTRYHVVTVFRTLLNSLYLSGVTSKIDA
jgi:hypothetical protein